MKATLFIILALHWMTGAGYASEVMPVPLASADVRGWVHTAGGPRIRINSPEGSIESVTISAWGREIRIPDAERAKLSGVIYSNVSISTEGRAKRFGGDLVIFTLSFQNMFGGDPFKGDPMLEHKVSIRVAEDASVEVSSEYINLKTGKKHDKGPTEQPANASDLKPEREGEPKPDSGAPAE